MPGEEKNGKEIREKSIEEQMRENRAWRGSPEMRDDLPEDASGDKISKEVEEWRDKYLRMYADLENTKKRLAKKMEFELREKTNAVLLDMLPVADNLERVLAYAREREDRELERGLEITLEAFLDAMRKQGVSRIKALGEPFNPEVHEAIGAVPTFNHEQDVVLKVEQTGYMLDGKVLRPSKVLIAAQ
jgi:molecular chaperone GrpE